MASPRRDIAARCERIHLSNGFKDSTKEHWRRTAIQCRELEKNHLEQNVIGRLTQFARVVASIELRLSCSIAVGLAMTQSFIFIVLGCVTIVLAIVLFVLRASIRSRQLASSLARRWTASSNAGAGMVLAALCAISAACFAGIGLVGTTSLDGSRPWTWDWKLADQSVGSEQNSASNGEQAFAALRDYVSDIAQGEGTVSATSQQPTAIALPDVDTMIASLASRLQDNPNDVRGWKMLAWSYLNTGRPDEAVMAYERALALSPGDAEIKKWLNAALSARSKDSRAGNLPRSP